MNHNIITFLELSHEPLAHFGLLAGSQGPIDIGPDLFKAFLTLRPSFAYPDEMEALVRLQRIVQNPARLREEDSLERLCGDFDLGNGGALLNPRLDVTAFILGFGIAGKLSGQLSEIGPLPEVRQGLLGRSLPGPPTRTGR